MQKFKSIQTKINKFDIGIYLSFLSTDKAKSGFGHRYEKNDKLSFASSERNTYGICKGLIPACCGSDATSSYVLSFLI